MTNQYLDAGRLNKYIVRQSTLYINEMMLAIATVFGLLLIVTAAVGYFSNGPISDDLFNFYGAAYILGGLVLSSVAFSELNNPHSSYAFLTMPVSTLEKLMGAWFITSIVYTAVYSLVVMIIYGLCALLFPKAVFSMSYLFSDNNLQIIGSYLVFQTVFILGATTFVKHNFLKTALSVFVIQLFLALFVALLAWILFNNSGSMTFNGEHDMNVTYKTEVKKLFEVGSKILFWFIIPAFMLVVSYFKLKERQV